MKYYLIDTASHTLVWEGETSPTSYSDKVVCEDEVYMCFNDTNTTVLYREDIPNFVRGKFTLINEDVLISPEWVEPQALEEIIQVPTEVTQRQAKEELIDIDLIDTIEAFLDAIPAPKQKRIGLNWYNNSQTFMRNNEFLNYVWTCLGKSQAELDTLFINAAKR